MTSMRHLSLISQEDLDRCHGIIQSCEALGESQIRLENKLFTMLSKHYIFVYREFLPFVEDLRAGRIRAHVPLESGISGTSPEPSKLAQAINKVQHDDDDAEKL